MKPLIGLMPLWDEEKESLWMLPGYMDWIFRGWPDRGISRINLFFGRYSGIRSSHGRRMRTAGKYSMPLYRQRSKGALFYSSQSVYIDGACAEEGVDDVLFSLRESCIRIIPLQLRKISEL